MFNKDFYPTPKKLIDEMLSKIDFKYINSVLEPSAGDGRLVEAIINKFKYSRYSSYDKKVKFDIDTVEINTELQYILKGKGFRLIHDDFLTLETYKNYDVIIANFPFSEGDKHLLKAISMQENGGQIVCLLNSETLKNPYSNTRKDLLDKLEQHNASIEYRQDAFISAENKTNVEIALIYINIPKKNNSIILDNLRQEEQFREEHYNSNSVIDSDFLKGIVQRYNFEVKAGLKLIAEYKALQPLMLTSFKDSCNNSILDLNLHYKDDSCTIENAYIRQVRKKYWQALFTNDQFMGLFTSNLRQEFYNKVDELKDYDFSLYNIYTIKIQLNNEMIKAVEETILNLFEELSHKYHWMNESSKNIHYYNGWKTNKAYKINHKVIIPLSGFRDMEYSWGRYDPTHYKVLEKLADIEKVFNYLDSGITEEVDMKTVLKAAEENGDTQKIQLKYFMVTFYKKGTCHIEFTNLDLLHKFNLFGSQRKGWLPPSYGKKSYNSMSEEEKEVVNQFEGKESYNKVIHNRDYYIVQTEKLLMLA